MRASSADRLAAHDASLSGRAEIKRLPVEHFDEGAALHVKGAGAVSRGKSRTALPPQFVDARLAGLGTSDHQEAHGPR